VIPSEETHLNTSYIPIVFDRGDPEQAKVLQWLMSSFGKQQTKIQDFTDPPRYCCVILCPGVVREVRR
jgi:hypothetical protein